jgi:hypothetical protein
MPGIAPLFERVGATRTSENNAPLPPGPSRPRTRRHTRIREQRSRYSILCVRGDIENPTPFDQVLNRHEALGTLDIVAGK